METRERKPTKAWVNNMQMPAGASIYGKLIGKYTSKHNASNYDLKIALYAPTKVKTKEGEEKCKPEDIVGINGTKMLSDLTRDVNVGSLVTITWLGQKDVGAKYPKVLFDVEVDNEKAPRQQVKREEVEEEPKQYKVAAKPRSILDD